MSTRKIKDALDLETKEKVYLKGHAKATYMSDGRTVEDAINSIDSGGGSGGGGSASIPIIKHGADDTIVTIEPNTYHKWEDVNSLTVNLSEQTNKNVMHEYMFSFINKSLFPQITLPELEWESGVMPDFAFWARNVIKVSDGMARVESYALPQMVLDIGSEESIENGTELYGALKPQLGLPGDYYVNTHIYIEVDFLEDYLCERVIAFRFFHDEDESGMIGLITEGQHLFYLDEYGYIMYGGQV